MLIVILIITLILMLIVWTVVFNSNIEFWWNKRKVNNINYLIKRIEIWNKNKNKDNNYNKMNNNNINKMKIIMIYRA